MTATSSASAAVTEGVKIDSPSLKKNGRNGKLRVMCRYGGDIVLLPQTKSLRYVGGDTRIVAVPPSAETSFALLVSHLTIALGFSYAFKVKYQLPDQELDSLISVETDEDVQIMLEEHGYLSFESSIPQTRIRLFIFPSKSQLNEAVASQGDPVQCKAVTDFSWLGIEESKPISHELTPPVLQHPKTEMWFVDALKGAEMMQTGRNDSGSNGSGDSNGGICGQESIMLETNTSFGSTSSSVCSSNLPPMKSTGEDSTANSQVKFAPIESVTSDNTAAIQISSHELPASPHVLENKLPSNLYGATSELNKPVPIPVSSYQPFVYQAQQQPFQVVYTGNSPMTLPAAAYHHTNHIQYQFPPQPYPIYYIPVEQYSSRHIPIPAPAVNPGTVSNTHQVGSVVVRTSSPLAPELASHVYPPPKLVDPSVQTSSEACRDAFIYNTDLDDDTARAQIYKSQPPAPIIPSQYQTMLLN